MSKFDDFYLKKSVKELLEKLRLAKITPGTMDKAWYEALIIHLQERELTMDEKNVLDRILSSDSDSLRTDKEVNQLLEPDLIKRESVSSFSSSEGGRYTALKTLNGLIILLCYLIVFVGIGGFLFFMFSQNQGLHGLVALVISIIIALLLFAYSNLIQVFIDIEYNTRKTSESLKVMNKQ